MEMELAISLTVRIDESGANLNEICAAIQESIRGEPPGNVIRLASSSRPSWKRSPVGKQMSRWPVRAVFTR